MLFLSRTSYLYIFHRGEKDVLTCYSFLNYSLGTTKTNAGSAEAFERIDRESVQVIEHILFQKLIYI